MQKFWKSVKIWQSYREFQGGTFFLRHSVVPKICFSAFLFCQSSTICIKATAIGSHSNESHCVGVHCLRSPLHMSKLKCFLWLWEDALVCKQCVFCLTLLLTTDLLTYLQGCGTCYKVGGTKRQGVWGMWITQWGTGAEPMAGAWMVVTRSLFDKCFPLSSLPFLSISTSLLPFSCRRKAAPCPHIQLGTLGEHCKLPSGVKAKNAFECIWSPGHESSGCKHHSISVEQNLTRGQLFLRWPHNHVYYVVSWVLNIYFISQQVQQTGYIKKRKTHKLQSHTHTHRLTQMAWCMCTVQCNKVTPHGEQKGKTSRCLSALHDQEDGQVSLGKN